MFVFLFKALLMHFHTESMLYSVSSSFLKLEIFRSTESNRKKLLKYKFFVLLKLIDTSMMSFLPCWVFLCSITLCFRIV